MCDSPVVTIVMGSSRPCSKYHLHMNSVTHLSLYLIRSYALDRTSSYWNQSMLTSSKVLLAPDTTILPQENCRAMTHCDLAGILRTLSADLSYISVKFSQLAECYLHEKDLLEILTDLGVRIDKEVYLDESDCAVTPGCSSKLDSCALHVIICTMQLLLNTRDDLSACTAMLIDDHLAFTSLRKEAQLAKMPLYQLATSYIMRRRLGRPGAVYMESCTSLDKFRPVFETFITCLNDMQNAVEEVTDPRECVMLIVRIVSKRLRDSRTSYSLSSSVSSASKEIHKKLDVCCNAQMFIKRQSQITKGGCLVGEAALGLIQTLVDSHFVSCHKVTSWNQLLSPSDPGSAAIPSLNNFLNTPEIEKEVEVLKDATPQRPVQDKAPIRNALSFVNQQSPVEARREGLCLSEKRPLLLREPIDKENIPPEFIIEDENKKKEISKIVSKVEKKKKKGKPALKKKLAFVCSQQSKITKFFAQN